MNIVHVQLDDLLDGRLTPDEHVRAETHLAGCDRCRAERERLAATADLLRRCADAEEMPPDLAGRIDSALDRESRPFRSMRMALAAMATAAAILIAVVVVRNPDMPAAAVGDYRSVVAADLPLELHTSNPGEMERWFATRLDFPTRVFDLGMMRYQLVGGRIDSIDGRRSALFVYRHDSGSLVVCEMYRGKTEELAKGAERVVQDGIDFYIYRRDGATAVFWQEGRVVCVLASDIAREEVVGLAFAKAMKARAT